MNKSEDVPPKISVHPPVNLPPPRYLVWLETSLLQSIQYAAFAPDTEALWANVRQTMTDFLLNEWKKGALLGSAPEQAFFVRCDRTTMTQSDLDNGRLVCVVGVAVIMPAEFVVFQIGQWTAVKKC
jgi:uncharacterized protein